MEMQKYKLCPVCGEHNPPSLLECRKCETDLTAVKPVDDSAQQEDSTVETSVETTAETPEKLVRVCDCGAENPPQARKCAVCGEDISDICPTIARKEEEQAPVFRLKAVEGEYAFTVSEAVSILGREGTMQEYLADRPYVSRRQAKLTIAAGDLFIENLSRTNGTFVGNEPLAEGAVTRLNDGDEIGLGGKVIGGKRQEKAAYFVFRAEK